MASDPAFLFYPGDYLRDTQTLSEKSQVAYDRIMCEHMRNICITKQQLKFFTKRLNEDEINELMFVLTKVNGGFQIEWVAESIEKRKAYSESRRRNRLKKDNNISLSYDEHMENENEIENINVINNKKKESFEKFKIVREKYYSNSSIHLSWIRQIKLSKEQLKKAIFDFFEECHAKEDIYRDELDYKSYCFNWIKKNQSKYLLITEL